MRENSSEVEIKEGGWVVGLERERGRVLGLERERERERERRREGGSKGIRGKMVERPEEREERMIVKNNEGVLKKKTDVIQLSE